MSTSRMSANNGYTRSAVAVVLLLLATGMLHGCGQKGPLYLPDMPGQHQQQK